MSSRGTASDISAQEASDLLHKFITESTKVRAAFRTVSDVLATVAGLVRVAPKGQFSIGAGDGADDVVLLMFNPSIALSFKYGDNRAFPGTTSEGGPTLSSALTFIFADGSQLTLFEIAE